MTETTEADRENNAWSVPVAVHELSEAGRRYQITPDERTRAALCRFAQLRDLPRLEATFDVVRRGRSMVHVVGHVSATVGQNCIVTLEPIVNEVEEGIDVVYTSETAEGDHDAIDIDFAAKEPPEPLVGGVLDLGQVATEFLMLGIEPYPRKPGATFEPPQTGDTEVHPFAALAALKKVPPGNES
jgi:hypothetical protein